MSNLQLWWLRANCLGPIAPVAFRHHLLRRAEHSQRNFCLSASAKLFPQLLPQETFLSPLAFDSSRAHQGMTSLLEQALYMAPASLRVIILVAICQSQGPVSQGMIFFTGRMCRPACVGSVSF